MDIVILCLLGLGLIKGLFDGVVKQVVALFALIVGIYMCSGIGNWLCAYLVQLEWFPQGAVVITSYFLGFIIIVGVVLLTGSIVHRIVDATPLSIFNHLIGGFIGLVLMVVFVSVLLNLLEMVDYQSAILPQEIREESRYYLLIKNIIPTLFPGNLFEIQNELFKT